MANQQIWQRGQFEAIELPAASAISPGMLCERASTGKLQPHSTASGFAEKIVAQEDALQGKTVTDNYATNDMVNAYIMDTGGLALMILVAGVAYAVADKLVSNGDGTLKKATGTDKQIIGTCIAALDLSVGGSVNTLSPVSLF